MGALVQVLVDVVTAECAGAGRQALAIMCISEPLCVTHHAGLYACAILRVSPAR